MVPVLDGKGTRDWTDALKALGEVMPTLVVAGNLVPP